MFNCSYFALFPSNVVKVTQTKFHLGVIDNQYGIVYKGKMPLFL